jgi:hypothetical protein
VSKGDLNFAIKIVDWLDGLSGEQLADAIPKIRNIRYYEFSNVHVQEVEAKVFLREEVEEGRYFARATTEDGEVCEWITEIGSTRYMRVPSRYADELRGKTLEKLQLFSYIPEVHFPKDYSLFGHSLKLDLATKTLTIDGIKIKIEVVDAWSSKAHGFGTIVKTSLKSIEGANINLAFYEDGAVSLYGVEAHPIQNLEIEPGKILVITYATKDASIPGESIIPLEPKELKVRTPIELGELSVDVEGKGSIRISEALKKVFGYDNFKTLQEEVESNEVGLLLRFDDGSTAYCRTPKFSVHVPEGAKKIVSVEIRPIKKDKKV